MRQKIQKSQSKIEKSKDREWLQWYNNLSKQDHKKYLNRLGLDKTNDGELNEIRKELKKAKTLEE